MRPTQEKRAALRRSPRKQFHNLGDTDTTTGDDEPETFRTPSQIPELTDYELNYSESPGPPRRCSTVRKQTSTERRSTRADRLHYDDDTTEDSERLESSAAEASSASKKKPAPKHRRKQSTPLKAEQQRQQKFLIEVNKLQKRTDFLIPRLPFSRLVREIMLDTSDSVQRITFTALEAIQTSAEMYLEQRLHDAYLLSLHRGRVTLDVRDMILINFLRHNSN